VSLFFADAALSDENACRLDREIGSCDDFSQRWYFDREDGECRAFLYGGCDGNANNFESLDECQSHCRPAAETKPVDPTEICRLLKAEGDCSGAELHWFYDLSDGVCKQFYYTGCDGNGNRFANRQQCESQCSLSQGLSNRLTTKNDLVMNQRSFVSLCVCRCRESDVCTLPRVVGPCSGSFRQWYYDAGADRCHQFDYGGCQGNPNRFNTEAECQQRCQKAQPTLAPPTPSVVSLYTTRSPPAAAPTPQEADGGDGGTVWRHLPTFLRTLSFASPRHLPTFLRTLFICFSAPSTDVFEHFFWLFAAPSTEVLACFGPALKTIRAELIGWFILNQSGALELKKH